MNKRICPGCLGTGKDPKDPGKQHDDCQGTGIFHCPECGWIDGVCKCPPKKVCPTEVHEYIKANAPLWQRLPLIGNEMGLEWRNCRCESTLAARVCQ